MNFLDRFYGLKNTDNDLYGGHNQLYNELKKASL